MKIEINCGTEKNAELLKNNILDDVKSGVYETWSHKPIKIEIDDSLIDGDAIYHDANQFMKPTEKQKHVIFVVERDKNKVIFQANYMKNNPKPDHDMYALHTGRLTEMLLKRDDILSFSVIA